MKVRARRGWKQLNRDFNKWYSGRAGTGYDWNSQRKWLSKELVKRKFIKEECLPEMWQIFGALTDKCSLWKTQSKILSLITLCLNDEIGEDLDRWIR